MIKSTMFDWMSFVVPLAMYESASVPLLVEEIMPSSGVAVLLRAYGAQWPMVGWNVAAT